MSKTKTGLMYSELSGQVYWGTMNTETGIARAGKKDVTSDFIGVMLQKFPVGFRQNIECNGETEAVVIMLKPENAHKHMVAKEMYEMLEQLSDWLSENDHHAECRKIDRLLAKAKGE